MAQTTSFNPRAHVGRDILSPTTGSMPMVFQSTRPRGARLRPSLSRCKHLGFNPRAHVGRDKDRTHYGQGSGSFNPRAHVGRDNPDGGNLYRFGVSIHAPTWGATGATRTWRFKTTRFNPRAHVGRDNFEPTTYESIVFQSTRPRGARLNRSNKRSIKRCFNPRAHVGRDCRR